MLVSNRVLAALGIAPFSHYLHPSIHFVNLSGQNYQLREKLLMVIVKFDSLGLPKGNLSTMDDFSSLQVHSGQVAKLDSFILMN